MSQIGIIYWTLRKKFPFFQAHFNICMFTKLIHTSGAIKTNCPPPFDFQFLTYKFK